MNNLSVVIPCYNDSKHLYDAVDSVLNQTTVPNEIIIVDDGSTEDISEAIGDHTSENRVQILSHEKNRGLPAARNTGIRNSESDYIAFLDSDDEWLAEKTQRQMNLFNRKDSLGLVYTDFYRVTPDGEVMSVRRTSNPPKEEFVKKAFISGTGGILPSTVIIPKKCFEVVGYFDERLRQAQELDMFIRIGAEFDIARVPEPLVKRRVRPNSLGSDKIQKIKYRREIITPKLVKKYPQLAALLDRREAYLAYLEASNLAENGEIKKARRLLIESIRDYPLEWKAYARFLMTLPGERAYEKLFRNIRDIKFRIRNIVEKIRRADLFNGKNGK